MISAAAYISQALDDQSAEPEPDDEEEEEGVDDDEDVDFESFFSVLLASCLSAPDLAEASISRLRLDVP